ncbi:MAG TPA: ABC transporter ATP-binding protein [Thermoplasmata archaeon]|jgi:ABC-2 type transport system ATP-binding protein|nr:ABC transporter ATP-binding protein [Thermoplasmata archaeon]
MGPAIHADRLRKVYPKAPAGAAALEQLTLDIPPGRVYGIIGRNGAGKTTFVRIAATQLAYSSGYIEVLGHDVRADPRAVRAQIACVPQESRPLYFLNVDEVVYLYLKLRGLDAPEARRRTRDVLAELSLTEYAHRSVQRLSGGLRRRTLCAMVLASDADVLFLDEPTTGLDPLARREVWEAIRRTSREGRTLVLTTHYLDEAEALSARLALFEKGRMMLEGAPADLRARVRYPYRVTVAAPFPRAELEPYGQVTSVEGGYLVFAREDDAREIARRALQRGAQLTMGPVSLEDIFLEVVGRSIHEDSEPTNGGGAGW